MKNDFLSYLKNPVIGEYREFKIEVFFSLFFFYILVVVPLGIMIYFLSKALCISKKDLNLTTQSQFFIGVILAPIYEEIIFRSLLIFKRKNIFLFCITIIGVTVLFILRARIEIAIFLSILFIFLILILIAFSEHQIESFISSRFKYFFYATILIFGLLHTFNFTGNIYILLAFSFIFGGPQIVLGSILGYIRMNYGLVFSILFHMIVNLSIIFSIIRGH